MKFNSTEYLIFGVAAVFLIFSIFLWIGRPKMNSKEKEKKKIKTNGKKKIQKN